MSYSYDTILGTTNSFYFIYSLTCHINTICGDFFWMKFKSHKKREAVSIHELLNDKVEELANIVHNDPGWNARDGAQTFDSALVELIIGRWGGSHRER